MTASMETLTVSPMKPDEGTSDAQAYHDRMVRHREAALRPLDAPSSVSRRSDTAKRSYWSAHAADLYGLNFPSPFETLTFRTLNDALSQAESSSDGDPSIVLIYGPNRSGKTTLVQRWLRVRYLAVIPEEAHQPRLVVTSGAERKVSDRYCPVIEIAVPAGCTPPALDATILEWINIPAQSKARQMALQADRALTQARCEALFFDDAHVMKGTTVVGANNLNRIKNYSSRLGKQGGVVVLTSNEDPSWFATRSLTLASRLVPVEVPYLNADTIEDRVTFQRFLNSAEDRLRPWFPKARGHLVEESSEIFRLTAGVMQDMQLLIKRVARTAAMEGSEAITRRHLANEHPSGLAMAVLGARNGLG